MAGVRFGFPVRPVVSAPPPGPETLSGVKFWIRGKDYTGANGSAITSGMLIDRSPSPIGMSCNGITVATGATPNGGRALDITNAINLNSSPALTNGDFWVVVKSRAAGGQAWALGQDTQATHFPFTGNDCYDKTFTSVRQSWTATATVVNVWHLYRVKNTSAGAWQSWMDNVSQKTATAAFGVAATARLAQDFNGLIAEALILDHVADATEKALLIAYFNSEHGLTVT